MSIAPSCPPPPTLGLLNGLCGSLVAARSRASSSTLYWPAYNSLRLISVCSLSWWLAWTLLGPVSGKTKYLFMFSFTPRWMPYPHGLIHRPFLETLVIKLTESSVCYHSKGRPKRGFKIHPAYDIMSFVGEVLEKLNWKSDLSSSLKYLDYRKDFPNKCVSTFGWQTVLYGCSLKYLSALGSLFFYSTLIFNLSVSTYMRRVRIRSILFLSLLPSDAFNLTWVDSHCSNNFPPPLLTPDPS